MVRVEGTFKAHPCSEQDHLHPEQGARPGSHIKRSKILLDIPQPLLKSRSSSNLGDQPLAKPQCPFSAAEYSMSSHYHRKRPLKVSFYGTSKLFHDSLPKEDGLELPALA